MIKRTLAVAFMCGITSTGCADHDTWSGHNFKKMCETSEDECAAWVIGLYSGFTFASEMLTDDLNAAPQKVGLCMPDDIAIDQMVEAFKEFLTKNPSYLDKPADVLAIHAWSQTWPCPK